MTVTTKQRIVDAGAELFRRQGYAGTGVKQIVATANAPFGSLYHFFPGGKVQLGEEVIRTSGAMYLQLVAAIFDPAPDVVTATGDFFRGAAQTLVDTDYADACPIATVALEVASTNDALRQATADVFESWIVAVGERFEAAGMSADTARATAICLVSLIEGAFVLCRSARSTEPLRVAGEAGMALVRAALPA
ncbi:TetR/AcrR family transcriptional regulator [Actinopolymorpha pittospori]|uniref:AcrR family transcriptional regulator n=1 Tax=Actinopolymorpha pittospori TaxID=648752 RepID=A0A927MS87_9ACTN|nr:AcrR family transcriptional regulator [Actinopolymorpha pittospori]